MKPWRKIKKVNIEANDFGLRRCRVNKLSMMDQREKSLGISLADQKQYDKKQSSKNNLNVLSEKIIYTNSIMNNIKISEDFLKSLTKEQLIKLLIDNQNQNQITSSITNNRLDKKH